MFLTLQAKIALCMILAWPLVRLTVRPTACHKPCPWPNKFTHRRIIRYRYCLLFSS